MPKALIIAEKPSVAADLARALAKAPGMTPFEKGKDSFENETHVISSAIMGVGATKRFSAVKWGIIGRMVWAWVLTLPVTALLGYGLEWLLLGR